MKKTNILPDKHILRITIIFIIIMMIIGTFFDLSISKALYDQNNIFGNILAAFGEYPSSLGFVASGTMIIIGRNKEHKVKNILQIILGIWFIISGSLMAAMLPTNYLDIPSILSIIIGLTCSILTILLITKLAKNTDRQTIIKLASVFIIVIFANIIIVNIIKIPWGRARYRLVAVNDQAYFMPWYQPGTTLKDTLVAQGVLKEEFKSFPSGHTANASCMLLISLLPALSSKLANKKNILFITGFIWTLLVALSRIIMGAHYLTDTMVALAVGTLVFITITKLIFSSR